MLFSPSHLNIMKINSNFPMKPISRLLLGLSLGLSCNAYSIEAQSESTQAASVAAEIKAFNITASSLDEALSNFGQQSGILVSISGVLSQGKRSQGVQGNYSVEQALKILLNGTGLTLLRQAQGSYIIIDSSKANTDIMTLGALQISDSQLNAPLAPYTVEQAPSTTRSNVPIAETSRSVQVITSEFIDDADIQSFDDALQYVSGASVKRRMGGVDKTYNMRGFQRAEGYRNGKRELFDIRTNMNTLETLEVLKGPASVNFGVNSPGGIVNYTTKVPQAETQRSIKVRLDEHGQREVIGDFTGATNESGTVLYRFIAAAEDSETFRDFSEQKTSTIAPSFTFLLNDKTQLTAAYELYRTELPVDRGVPVGELSDGSFAIADVPIERRVGEPGDVAIDDTHLFDLTLNHQFNDGWQGELSYSYQNSEGKWHDIQIDDVYLEETDVDGVLFPAGSITREGAGYLNRAIETHQASAILHGDFELGGIQHKITTGADYVISDLEAAWGETDAQPSAENPTIFNIYNPVYGEISTELTLTDDDTETTNSHGLFISDTAYLGDNFIVNLAGRYDYYDYEYSEEYEDPADNYSDQEKDDAFTWNAGLLYKLLPAASLYLSYATSYEPNSANDLIGELKPQEGEQWELGIKGLAMSDTLQYSLVFFDITKTNMPTEFEDANGDEFIKLIGKQSSKGIELDANWQIIENVSLLTNYAYIDADASLTATPEHSGALFVSYALTPMVSGLTVMGGVNYVDDVFGNQDQTYIVPGSTSYDLSLKYRLALAEDDALLLQTGIKNLTDEVIYIHHSKDSVAFGQPRTLYANLAYQF